MTETARGVSSDERTELARRQQIAQSHGLRTVDAGTAADAPSDETWSSLLSWARTRRVSGLLSGAVADGTIGLTPDQHGELDQALTQATSSMLEIERELLDLEDALRVRGVPTRVLKGTAHAHLVYPDPSLRQFGDVDILVRGDDMAEVTSLLARRGGRRHYAEPRPGYDRRFTKGAPHTLPSGVEVDVHRTLCPGPYGLTIDVDELWRDQETFIVADTRLSALGWTTRVVHTALHAVLGSANVNLVGLHDLARHLQDPPPDGEDQMIDLAGRWKVETPVALALQTAEDRFGPDIAPQAFAWTRVRSPSARDRRWLTAYRAGTRSYAAQALYGLEAVRGTGARLAYARAIAFPRRASGRHRAIDRWRRGWHAAVGRRSP